MSEPTLIELLKTCALSAGYELLAEDAQHDESYLEPDQFAVRDANRITYFVSVAPGGGG